MRLNNISDEDLKSLKHPYQCLKYALLYWSKFPKTKIYYDNDHVIIYDRKSKKYRDIIGRYFMGKRFSELKRSYKLEHILNSFDELPKQYTNLLRIYMNKL